MTGEASGSLDGVREKLLRADEHLHEFRVTVARHLAFDPIAVVRKFEDHIPEKSGRAGLTWRAKVETEPPLSLSVIAGDLIHNLRSALDHLAQQLVLVNGGIPEDERNPKTQFPIITSQGTPTIHARSGTISRKAQAILEAVQPDETGEHPLHIVQTLSNIDKHRRIVFTQLGMGHIVQEGPGRRVTAYRNDVNDGTMVSWLLVDNPAWDPDVEMETHFTTEIHLSEAGIRPGTALREPAGKLLSDTVEFVRESVVQRLARACLGGPIVF